MSRPDLDTGSLRSWQAFDVTPQISAEGQHMSI